MLLRLARATHERLSLGLGADELARAVARAIHEAHGRALTGPDYDRPRRYTSRSCGRASPSASPSRSRKRGSGKVNSRASAAIVSPFCSASAKARLIMMGISPVGCQNCAIGLDLAF
jgi:hypothetical protein